MMRKMIATMLMSMAAVQVMAGTAEAATEPAEGFTAYFNTYSVYDEEYIPLEFEADQTFAILVGSDHRWVVKVNGQVRNVVAQDTTPSADPHLWYSTIINIRNSNKEKYVVLKRDGHVVMSTRF
jgi:hypothetical protein